MRDAGIMLERPARQTTVDKVAKEIYLGG